MTTLLLTGLLAFAETPEKTVEAFVAAFNARNPIAMSREVVGGGAAENPMLTTLPKEFQLKAVLGEAKVTGDTATVEADVELLGERNNSKSSHETIQLTKTNGNWQIISKDPNSVGMREAEYVSMLAYMAGHPEVFAQAKKAAKKTACLSNVKQLALGTIMYSGDHDDFLPKTSAGWKKAIMPYVKNEGIFHCPEDTSGKDSYFLDPRVAGKSMAAIASPAQTAMIVEGSVKKTEFRHAGTCSIGFIDGHAKILKPALVLAARTVKLN